MAGSYEDAPVGTPIVVSVASGLLALAGLFTAVGGVQILMVAEIWSVFRFLPPVQVVLGAAAIGVAAMLYDCRPVWAAVGALLALLMVAVGAVWNVYATLNLFFSLLTWIALGITMLAAVVVPFAVLPSKRTNDARRSLAGGLF